LTATKPNAVQLLMNARNPMLFQYIPGRNKAIHGTRKQSGFVGVFPKRELVTKRGWQRVENDASYQTDP
jgi:hypothetical protein